MKLQKKYLVFLALFLFSLGADQGSKMWARAQLKPKHEAVTVVSGYWDFRYSENEGAAFGLFRGLPGARYLLFIVGVGALAVIWSFLRKAKPEQLRLAAELGLLAGGAIGNIVDRVAFGRVTDFIVWKFHGHEWPTFNIADAALVIGVAALLLDMRTDGEKADEGAADDEKKKKSK